MQRFHAEVNFPIKCIPKIENVYSTLVVIKHDNDMTMMGNILTL